MVFSRLFPMNVRDPNCEEHFEMGIFCIIFKYLNYIKEASFLGGKSVLEIYSTQGKHSLKIEEM